MLHRHSVTNWWWDEYIGLLHLQSTSNLHILLMYRILFYPFSWQSNHSFSSSELGGTWLLFDTTKGLKILMFLNRGRSVPQFCRSDWQSLPKGGGRHWHEHAHLQTAQTCCLLCSMPRSEWKAKWQDKRWKSVLMLKSASVPFGVLVILVIDRFY